jgi:hypothetical protein
MLAAVSLVALAIVVAAMTRSYRVMDTIFRDNITKEPLTPAAARYAAKRGIAPSYVARQRSWSVRLVRGRAVITHHEAREPISAADGAFEDNFLSHPLWRREHSLLEPVPDWWQAGWLGRLGFAAEQRSSPVVMHDEFRRMTLPLWPING